MEQNRFWNIQTRTEQENENFQRHIKGDIIDLDFAIKDITYGSDNDLNMSCRKLLKYCLDKVQKIEEDISNGYLMDVLSGKHLLNQKLTPLSVV
jgi:hypothetical protein